MNAPDYRPKAVIICGPTGSGKTGIALELARKFGGEIIGADSMQIYRHMDIGTAKPNRDEMSVVRHHLVDIVEPDEPFDARKYAVLAFQAVNDLRARGVLPLVVGGTGLYIKSLVFGLFDADPADPMIRHRLKTEARKMGSHALYERLIDHDPETAARLHANDTYRIVRALEVYEITGLPLSAYHRNHGFKTRRLDTLSLGLQMDRSRLYARIDNRVDAMIEAGLLDEVRRLMNAGYSPELKAMQSIGYRHMVDFIEKRTDWETAVRTMKRDTRRYAKRQLTWFRTDPDIHWILPEDTSKAERMIGDYIVTL